MPKFDVTLGSPGFALGHERLGRVGRKFGYVRYGPTATKFFSAAACRDGTIRRHSRSLDVFAYLLSRASRDKLEEGACLFGLPE
jgi:hypothetical protein